MAYHAPHWPYEPPSPELNPRMDAGTEVDKFHDFHAMIEALDHEVERLVAATGQLDAR